MIDEGGPAFPTPEVLNFNGDVQTPAFEGMSLRDWFAGQVMLESIRTASNLATAADAAYAYADAMIEARKYQ